MFLLAIGAKPATPAPPSDYPPLLHSQHPNATRRRQPFPEISAEIQSMPPTITLDRLLVVAEPWSSLLVDGAKTWELRTTSTKVRGPVGIAAKGTGTIIGAIELVAVHGPFTRAEIAPYEHLHRVPASSTSTYSGPKGLYAWEDDRCGEVRYAGPLSASPGGGDLGTTRPAR
jgi:hypothetical protein